MIGLLETRLDTVVFRSKFVPTPFAARQLVSHGHVKVNGRRVTIASYHVKDNDTIDLSPKAREMALVMEASKSSGTRHARLSGSPGRQDRQAAAHPQAGRCAVSRTDGTALDRRVLLAIKRGLRKTQSPPALLAGFSFARSG
jgi:ribosomal protein S4